MGLTLFLIWIFICGYAFLSNRDIFSPVKLYLLNTFVYFADLFLKEYPFEIYLTYLLYLLAGLLLAMLEAGYRKGSGSVINSETLIASSQLTRMTVLMWLLTLIPLGGQLYLFNHMGGVENYLARLGFRVLEWQGLGHVLTAIRFINVITIFYFGIGLIACIKRPRLWWLLFSLHFMIFMSLGLLSGSRGFLEIIVIMLIMYHYLKRRITTRAAVSIGVMLFVAATVMGIARSGFKVDEGKIITGFSYGDKERLKLRQGDYGIQPLDLVYSQEAKELQFGKTFLSGITNFVPRSLWPGKPDTGGVVLTKQYTGDAWDGASNLSTGVIAESILNFGYVGGVACGGALLLGSMLLIGAIYRKVILTRATDDPLTMLLIVMLYINAIKTTAGIAIMEFTNAALPLALNCAMYVAVYLLIKYRIRIFRFKPALGTKT